MNLPKGPRKLPNVLLVFADQLRVTSSGMLGAAPFNTAQLGVGATV